MSDFIISCGSELSEGVLEQKRAELKTMEIYFQNKIVCRRSFHDRFFFPHKDPDLPVRLCHSPAFLARYPTAIPCDLCTENIPVRVVDTRETVRKIQGIVCFLQRNPASVPHITPQAVVDVYLGLKGTKTIPKELPVDMLKSSISWTKHPLLRKDAVEELVQKMVWMGNLTEKVSRAATPNGKLVTVLSCNESLPLSPMLDTLAIPDKSVNNPP